MRRGQDCGYFPSRLTLEINKTDPIRLSSQAASTVQTPEITIGRLKRCIYGDDFKTFAKESFGKSQCDLKETLAPNEKIVL